MINPIPNYALIIGHPGHELRIFKFLELYKPRVYVLTDGSGVSGTSRINSTIKILKDSGASLSPVMGYYTDQEIYRVILENDMESLLSLINKIQLDFAENNINAVMGDAIEGFNPTHDLCRYLINTIVSNIENKTGIKIDNYDFKLEGIITKNVDEETISVLLSEEDFDRKAAAAENYKELAYELNYAVQKYGKEVFKAEYLRKVNKPYISTCWEGEEPFYEKYAKEKIKSGKYKNIITYNNHLAPLHNKLLASDK